MRPVWALCIVRCVLNRRCAVSGVYDKRSSDEKSVCRLSVSSAKEKECYVSQIERQTNMQCISDFI